MRPICSECEAEIETPYVFALDYEPVCSDCMYAATPWWAWWLVSLLERTVGPIYEKREESSN